MVSVYFVPSSGFIRMLCRFVVGRRIQVNVDSVVCNHQRYGSVEVPIDDRTKTQCCLIHLAKLLHERAVEQDRMTEALREPWRNDEWLVDTPAVDQPSCEPGRPGLIDTEDQHGLRVTLQSLSASI